MKERIKLVPGFFLERLKEHLDYADEFVYNVTSSIENDYQEIDSLFAKNLIYSELNGERYGFFSLQKEIWVLIAEQDKKIYGFEVVTLKRGGSLKLGPTYIAASIRGKAYAQLMIQSICKHYATNGWRKVYVTAPLMNKAAGKLDFEKLGFTMEAVLKKQYSDNSNERISSLFLKECKESRKIPVNIDYGNKKIRGIRQVDRDSEFASIEKFFLQNMRDYYNDIDQSFFDNLKNRILAGIDVRYEEKGKVMFCIYDEMNLVGGFICTLKRGGGIKIAPLLIDRKYINPNNIKRVLDRIISYAKEKKRRKITIFVPNNEISLINGIIDNGFNCEGMLREPYKEGVDMSLMVKFIENSFLTF